MSTSAAPVAAVPALPGQEDREPSPELPLTMTASAMLSSLPRDATAALATAASFSKEKVVVLFKPVGSAPSLKRNQYQIGSLQKFEWVVRNLRRLLSVKDSESLFLYINSSFAPSLDEIVGNLHRCFKNGQDQLVVNYSLTPAFG